MDYLFGLERNGDFISGRGSRTKEREMGVLMHGALVRWLNIFIQWRRFRDEKGRDCRRECAPRTMGKTLMISWQYSYSGIFRGNNCQRVSMKSKCYCRLPILFNCRIRKQGTISFETLGSKNAKLFYLIIKLQKNHYHSIINVYLLASFKKKQSEITKKAFKLTYFS